MQTSSIRMEQPPKQHVSVNSVSRRSAHNAGSDDSFYEKLQAVQKEYEPDKTDSPNISQNSQQDNAAAETEQDAPFDENQEIANETETAQSSVHGGKLCRKIDGTQKSVYAFLSADEAALPSESGIASDASASPAADDKTNQHYAVFLPHGLNKADNAAETPAANVPESSEQMKNIFSKKQNDKKIISAKGRQEISADNELSAAAYQFTGQEIPRGNEHAALPIDTDLSDSKVVFRKKAAIKDTVITVYDERTTVPEVIDGTEIVRVNGAQETEMEMHLGAANAGNKTLFAVDDSSLAHSSSSPAASQFASVLSQQIQSGADQFVRAGSIVLKDNNRGTINLVLHPEELGNVKIQLELTDKVIAGKIIVSSEEAYNAFKANLQNLKDSFVSGGFADAGFDVSWAGSSAGGEPGDSGGNGSGQYHAKNMHGGKYSESMGVVAVEPGNDAGNYYRNSSINIVA